MARSNFGGTDSAAWVMGAPSTHGSFAVSSPNLTGGTAWDSATGGTQYTDLILVGGGATTVRTDVDGFVKAMQGPDGVNEGMWIDLGGGSRFWLRTTDSLDSKYLPTNIFLGIGGFDPVALTGPDDSALLQAAVTRAAAESDLGRRIIKVKPGCYKISVPITGIPAYLQIVGDGVGTTRICYTGTGVMFDVGTYTTTPGGLYEGTKQGFTLRDIWVDVPSNAGFTSEGSRVPTCVRDNANGSMRFDHAKISGFACGFNGAWGSDFTEFHDSTFAYNDVGTYFGPGSQQVRVNGVMFMGNRESAVIERTIQGSFKDCQFVDSSVADITAVYNAASIRSGIATSNGSAYNFAAWTVEDCWFESGAFSGRTPCPQHILTTGDTASYPQYLKVSRPILVSGGTTSSTDAFWRVAQGTRFLLENLTVYGGEIKYAVDTGTVACVFTQRNTRQTDGSGGNTLVLWGGTASPNKQYEESITAAGVQGITATAAVSKTRVIGDAVERWHLLANGKQEFGGGAVAPDMYIDWATTAVMRLGGGTIRISPAQGSQVHLDMLPIATQSASYLKARTSGGLIVSEIDLNGNWHGGITTKAGTPVDGDFGVARDGLCCIDTTASKFWIRVGGVWKSATFT